ncbi:MAG: hypothetical protein ACOCNH_05170 [Bacteroidales bacterium]
MKKTYLSPALTVYSLNTESDMLGLTLSADSGSTGNTVDNDTEWDTNKKQPGFAGSMWDNMGETGNF